MEYILESGRIIKEGRLVDFSESDLGDLPPPLTALPVVTVDSL